MAFFAAPSVPRMGSISLPSVTSSDSRTTDDGHTYVDTPPPSQSLRLNSPHKTDEATESNALALFLEPPSEIGLPPPAQPSRPELEVRVAQLSLVNTLQPVSSTGPTSLGRHFQEGHPSFLVQNENQTGDVQASPLNERNAHDGPVDMAVELVQEARYSARATALETALVLLGAIDQQGHSNSLREEAKHLVATFGFFTLLRAFKRDPYANIQEALEAFYLVTALIREQVMQRLDLMTVVWLLFLGGNFDGCRLLILLVSGNTSIDLTEEDINFLEDLALCV